MTVSDTLPNMFLNVNGLGGNDTFTVGGRDFDEGNFFAGNTTLNGGGGTDSITFDDRDDDYANEPGENEIYSFNNRLLQKDANGFTFDEFENQTLRTANGMSGSFLTNNTVNLNSFTPSILSTTITAPTFAAARYMSAPEMSGFCPARSPARLDPVVAMRCC